MTKQSNNASDEVAISARNLGKLYPHFQRPQDRLKQMIWGRGWRRDRYWAVRGLDVDIPHGQTLGILGRNGSGKSTLLQSCRCCAEPSLHRAVNWL